MIRENASQQIDSNCPGTRTTCSLQSDSTLRYKGNYAIELEWPVFVKLFSKTRMHRKEREPAGTQGLHCRTSVIVVTGKCKSLQFASDCAVHQLELPM